MIVFFIRTRVRRTSKSTALGSYSFTECDDDTTTRATSPMQWRQVYLSALFLFFTPSCSFKDGRLPLRFSTGFHSQRSGIGIELNSQDLSLKRRVRERGLVIHALCSGYSPSVISLSYSKEQQSRVVGGCRSCNYKRVGEERHNWRHRSGSSRHVALSAGGNLEPDPEIAKADEIFEQKLREGADKYKDALAKTGFVVAAALAFDIGVLWFKGPSSALDFVSGFLVEESLSVDNLFVFLLLFDYFKVPVAYQGRVLKWGLIGAVVLRGIFIALGVVALEKFRAVLLLFSGILIVSSGKLILEFVGDGSDDDEEDLSQNAVVQFATKVVDTTDEYDSDRFFTNVPSHDNQEQLVRKATPLLLALVCVELTDVVFAVDSVPAVFGVTEDPFIVFSSNIFAILGLRSLFTGKESFSMLLASNEPYVYHQLCGLYFCLLFNNILI